MLEMIGINSKTVNSKSVVLIVDKKTKKIHDYILVRGFEDFAKKYVLDSTIDNEWDYIALYIPLQDKKHKYFKQCINTKYQVLDNINFKIDEDGCIIGIDSFVFDIKDKEVYAWLYKIKTINEIAD